MIDISRAIDPEDIPLCPLCDQPIMRYETVAIGTAAGAVALVHEVCAKELLEECEGGQCG